MNVLQVNSSDMKFGDDGFPDIASLNLDDDHQKMRQQKRWDDLQRERGWKPQQQPPQQQRQEASGSNSPFAAYRPSDDGYGPSSQGTTCSVDVLDLCPAIAL